MTIYRFAQFGRDLLNKSFRQRWGLRRKVLTVLEHALQHVPGLQHIGIGNHPIDRLLVREKHPALSIPIHRKNEVVGRVNVDGSSTGFPAPLEISAISSS